MTNKPAAVPAPSLVSVIIPCYNHAAYLPKAIESILTQTYNKYEIIVVDDGSTDNTKQVTEAYVNVQYVYQRNGGLSAARNTGIAHSTGEYLLFLDADDWLPADAFDINLRYLSQNEEAAFVSGGHQKVDNNGVVLEEQREQVTSNHYPQFLQGNYIGMHATVLYRRWVFDYFTFDTTLRACEDYDLYLKVSRKFPVIHHQELIAFYRIHDSNMSGNIPFMLEHVLMVLNRQKDCLLNKAEKQAHQNGVHVWRAYYTQKLYNYLLLQPIAVIRNNKIALKTLRRHSPTLYLKLFTKKLNMLLKRTVKKVLKKLPFRKGAPAVGWVNMGDFDRVTPFNTQFGYDRGGPVDRYYIENFLEQQKSFIAGRVLEIGDNEYTLRFGGERIAQSDILHVDEKNPKATFVGDLSNAPHLPDNAFDCIILTQTLHLIYDYVSAIKTCYRILKPGGRLLLTVPGISHIDQDKWKDIWLWSFTNTSISKILAEVFPTDKTTITTHGNVLVATAFLYGMGLPEIKKKKMDYCDPHYQVIITACAIKP